MADHIQIGDIAPRIQYAANGAQTQFTYPFPIFVAADMEVYLGAAKQTSGFTVAGAGASAGGSVMFAAAPANGTVVTLRRNIAIKRMSDFQESGEFRAKVINDELDYQTAALQQVADDAARAVRLSPTDAAADLMLPDKAARSNKLLACDADGYIIPAAGATSIPVSGFAATVLDDADATAARATLGLVIGTNVLAPNGDGSALTNLPLDATLASDIRLLSLETAALKGDRLNMVNGWADPLKDETDIETAQNVAATYVSTGGGYYHNPGTPVLVDSYSESNQDGSNAMFSGAAVARNSQSFTLGAQKTLHSATFQLHKTGSPTGTLKYQLFAATGPTGSPTGAALAETATLDASTVSASNTLYELVFTSDYVAAVGDYCIVCNGSSITGDASNNIRVHVDASAPSHAGAGYKSSDGSSWSNDGWDLCFYIYDAGAPPNMTVVSKAVVAASVAPTVGRLHVQIKDITGGSTVNTDFKGYVSRDNGTTYTQGTLALVQTLADATKAYEFDNLDISAQPSGTAPRFKFTTHNNKGIQLHGAVVQWK